MKPKFSKKAQVQAAPRHARGSLRLVPGPGPQCVRVLNLNVMKSSERRSAYHVSLFMKLNEIIQVFDLNCMALTGMNRVLIICFMKLSDITRVLYSKCMKSALIVGPQ